MQPKDLLDKLKSSKVVFHKFVLLHREHGDDLFCFFEGADSQYYFPRINAINENHQFLICGNKKNVLETYTFVKSKYNRYKTIFFVDSDFEKTEEKEGLFFTCGYSIENYYCHESVFSKILKNEFHFNVTDDEYITLMDLFNERQKEFHKSTCLFNLWYYSAKQKAHKNKTTVNASLSEKFPKEFINFSLNNIHSTYTLDDIKAKFKKSIEITEDEIKHNKSNFFSKEAVYLFRGKFEIDFFIKFLQLLINDANNDKKFMSKKTSFKIDSALVLSQLSQYAVTTNRLNTFLKRYA